MHWFELLIPDQLWAKVLMYIAGSWVVNVALLRYTPANCPETYESVEWVNGHQKPVIKHRDDDYCKNNFFDGHMFHLAPHRLAGVWAWLWPIAVPVTIFVGLVLGFVYSVLKAGRYFETSGTHVIEED